MPTGTRRPLLVLTLLLAASLPLVTARIYASDEVQYFAYLRSLWFDRDVSFENEYRHFYDAGITRTTGFHETFLERRTEETGLRVSFATIGSALLWSPFYGVADATVRLRRALGATIAADGYSQPYVAAVAYGSAVYGWLAVVLGWWMARRLAGEARALPAALAIWLGTPLFFYMYVAPPMSHACSAFAVAAFLATWLKVRDGWSVGGCAALGALAALMAMVREQDVFIAIGPGVDWVWSTLNAWRQRPAASGSPDLEPASGIGEGLVRRTIAQSAAAAVAFFVSYAPQLWAYTVLNGYPGPSRLVGRKMTWTAPHALSVLLSPEHGLLFWTPLVALALAGLVGLVVRGTGVQERGSAAAQERGGAGADGRRIGICLLLVAASQVYVAGSVESWSVAGAFGQRRFIGLTVVFCIGLAVLWTRARRPAAKAAAAAAIALATWWNLGLAAQFGAGLMDRQRLQLTANAYHTFVTIPARLPDLAYRYVFSRGSFYKGSSSAAP
jgi:hypothetical protein